MYTKNVDLRYRKLKHFVELKELGYIYESVGKLSGLERRAHKFAELNCNSDIPEKVLDRKLDGFVREATRLFGGQLPDKFYINLDPRGYALKIDQEGNSKPLSYTDMGGYGILAPDWDE